MFKRVYYIHIYLTILLVGMPLIVFCRDATMRNTGPSFLQQPDSTILQQSDSIAALQLIDTVALFDSNVVLANLAQQARMRATVAQMVEKASQLGLLEKTVKDSIMQFLTPGAAMVEGERPFRLNPASPVGLTKNEKEISSSLFLDSRSGISSEIRNGINPSMTLPDKLFVPERDAKNRNTYMSQEQVKERMLQIDYFSKGIDGYYQKMIACGMTGAGWEDTKAVREAMERLRVSMEMHLSDVTDTTPDFIKKMGKSNSSFVRILGMLLRMMNNGAMAGAARSAPGYHNPNYLIRTPPAPPMSK